MARWLQGQENTVSAMPVTPKALLYLETPCKRWVCLSDDLLPRLHNLSVPGKQPHPEAEQSSSSG